MTVSAVKIIQPGEIQGLPDDETPLLVLPLAKEILKERSTRLEQLATDGTLKDWLNFCSKVAKAQYESIDDIAVETLEENVIKESLKHGMPPASIGTWKAGTDWDQAFDLLSKALAKQELPESVKKVLNGFVAANGPEMRLQAEQYLQANEANVKLEWAPFIGAILQMIWMKKVAQLAPHAASYKGQSTLCPVCGSHPIASVVRVGTRDAHRYLVCSLCSSEWYASRARCTNCETPKEVNMMGETKESLVQGECCDDCHGYLKIMYQSRDPMMEVMADDLASIQVDLALSNEGYQRTGRNMFFMVGSETTEKDTQ
jgi:FdhE protein